MTGLFQMLRAALERNPPTHLLTWALRLALLRLRFDRSRGQRPQRLLAVEALKLSLRTYQGRAPVVFTSLLTPPELLHALGLIPFNLEAAGCVTPSLGLVPRALTVAERAWTPADSCTVLRAALGAAQMGLLPRPLALVCTSCLCDSTHGAFATVADRLGRLPFRLLDVPYTDSPEAVTYLAEQLEALGNELAAMTDRRLNPVRLAEAVRLSNEARGHLVAIARLRRTHPGLLGAEDALHFLYPTSVLLGSPAGVSVFDSYRAELAATAHRRPADPAGPRLLWLHLLPYYRHDLLAMVETAGARVVFEEASQIYWRDLDPGRPFEALARRCIGHFWNGPLERRVQPLLALVREHRVDGIVHFCHHGCRQSWGALRALRDAMVGEGIPFLELEGDLVDARNRAEGQQSTRLEAFIETLASRGC